VTVRLQSALSRTAPGPIHRPRVGRRRALGLATATVVAGGLLVGLAPAAAHASSADNATVLEHLNALRAKHGLGGLTEIGPLMSLATGHSEQMAGKETIFHNPDLTSEAPSNWEVLGENVGMGPSATAIDTAFDNSPEHFANEINSSYTEVGIGTATDSRGYLYITVDFMKPMGAAPAPVAPKPAPKPAPVAPAPVKPAAPLNAATVHAALRATPTQAAASRIRFTNSQVAAARAAVAKQVLVAHATRPVLSMAGVIADPLATALAFSHDVAELRS
jgi:uncharacterized protein YkwD